MYIGLCIHAYINACMHVCIHMYIDLHFISLICNPFPTAMIPYLLNGRIALPIIDLSRNNENMGGYEQIKKGIINREKKSTNN